MTFVLFEEKLDYDFFYKIIKALLPLFNFQDGESPLNLPTNILNGMYPRTISSSYIITKVIVSYLEVINNYLINYLQ